METKLEKAYKLFNHAVFGKTMENVRKRIDFEICGNVRAERLGSTLRWDGHIVYKPGQVYGIKKRKLKIKLDKPIYVGLAILDLSKLWMYRFHYDWVKRTYGAKAKLLFTDTDSLMYHIEADDVYGDMARTDLFDLSNYPRDHPLYSDRNRKVLGKFKDEAAGIPIVEFVGLKSKMYSVLLANDTVKSTAKGIMKSVHLSHEQYKRALFDTKDTHTVSYDTIRSRKHVLCPEHVTKQGLSGFDDKSYMLPDGISQLRHGHYSLSSNKT